MNAIKVRHHSLILPVFLPDATYGYVRALSASDLKTVGLQAIMMNAFHLMQKPGSTVVSTLGGLHAMSGWDRLIMTDSGGFQAYSLIRQNPKYGSLNDKGIIFYPEGSSRKLLLTPEKSIQLQLSFGSDILTCLDDCTHVDNSREEQEKSVQLTLSWAKKARQTYDQLLQSRNSKNEDRPLIFAVIQGGGEFDLRKRCAESLLEIGFDGFGFGGWPLDSDSNLLIDLLEYTRSVVPRQFPIHALGIGHPESIAACYKLGYEMFDSALPTRDARHGRLYTIEAGLTKITAENKFLKFKYINSEIHHRSKLPIREGCQCPVCSQLSLGYLYHLYRMGDPLYPRLATQHNLQFMEDLVSELRNNAI